MASTEQNHAGETVAHVTCFGSGCAVFGGVCLLKARVKDGELEWLDYEPLTMKDGLCYCGLLSFS